MDFEPYRDYPEWWEKFVNQQVHSHTLYYKYLIKDCVTEGQNPIYFLRYEDLVKDQAKELKGLFRFLLDKDDLTGTNVLKRIEAVVLNANKG